MSLISVLQFSNGAQFLNTTCVAALSTCFLRGSPPAAAAAAAVAVAAAAAAIVLVTVIFLVTKIYASK